MHKTTGEWKLGLALALATAVLWGILPVALKLLLAVMDVYTITWYRFLAAALLLGLFLAKQGTLPPLSKLSARGWGLLAIAILGLCGNYLFYLLGLNFVTPGAAQIVIQLAPMLLLLGGLVVFGERFVALQWAGFLILLLGMLLFFNHRLREILSNFDTYTIGILLVIIASITWAAYALAQKQLLRQLASEQIMVLIYVAGAVLFLPAADPASLLTLDGFGLFLLAFASLNTLLAYGAFAEALDHWEASRVSAVLAITPLLTLLFMFLIGLATTRVVAEPVNVISIFGAMLVAVGSVVTALGGRRAAKVSSAAPIE